MKVVVIGGGIAGISAGILLHQRNINVVVNERGNGTLEQGHAFLMHTDGLRILKEMNQGKPVNFLGENAGTFSLHKPDGEKLKHMHLNSWKCIKRNTLVHFLESLLPSHLIKYNRKFSHFILENEKPVAAVFTNGDVEYGDVFIGADGGNSKVREAVFGPTRFNSINVKEIIGISCHPKIAQKYKGAFTKFHDEDNSLAFGFIPTSENEMVWFIQFNPQKYTDPITTGDELKRFTTNLIAGFPDVVKELVASNDFSKSYVWNTRDFDLLPKFHHKNVVLIGDAAHLSLPFTSAGTTNALIDAKTVADNIVKFNNVNAAFTQYYNTRSEEIGSHIQLGRTLQHLFLNPTSKEGKDVPLPLISKNKAAKAPVYKPINIVYFTDPICSTCWVKQPNIRKLKLEYGDFINIEFRMGGLLPCWNTYKLRKGKIQNPIDAANHWEEVCSIYKMPLDGDIWIEDPLASSFPPSIAFKAAQLQGQDLAEAFLRRISEMVFVEKRNIHKLKYIEQAAFESGLDTVRFLKDYEEKALDLFKADMQMAAELRVTSLPTLIFSDNNGKEIKINGYHPYEKLEEILGFMMPGIQKVNYNTRPEKLFDCFPTMTNKEFEIIGNLSIDSASTILADLYNKGEVDKFVSKNGIIWKKHPEMHLV